MRTRRLLPAVLGLLLATIAFAPACSDGGRDSTIGSADDLQSMSAALTAFESCDDLDSYLRDVILNELDERLALAAEGYYYGYPTDVAVGAPRGADWGAEGSQNAAPPTSMDDGTPTNTGGSGSDSEPYSDTNVQEQGVDEADFVKTDGEFLYILNAGALRIVKASPVEEMALLSSIEVEGYPTEMFLEGDRILIFSSLYQYGQDMYYDAVGGTGGVPATRTEPAAGAEGTDSFDAPLTVEDGLAELSGEILKLTVIDVSDRSAPAMLREIYLEGGYVSARMVDGAAHIVLRSYPHIPAIDWYGYYDDVVRPDTTEPGGDPPPVAVDAGSGTATASTDTASGASEEYKEEQAALTSFEDATEEARSAFLDLLSDMSLQDLMPKRMEIRDGEAEISMLVPCDSFFHPSVTMGLNILAVVSIDLDEPAAAPEAAGILGSSDTVYGSPSALYVATYVYDYWMWERWAEQSAEGDIAEQTERTAIHAFDISSGRALYAASGFVDGRVLNQFSMGEHDGYLRVATTWRNWFTNEPSENGLFVLDQVDDALEVVGQVVGIALGEQIYAARFLGERGFVVTYEQVDPLFTFDLSDPTAPEIVGELEVPGYSSYIHPLGDDHLLTVGRMTTDHGDWVEMGGLKLSIYDVSDFANPTLVQDHVMDEAYSEAEYNHKAFTYFDPAGALAVPIGSYWWNADGEMPPNGLGVFLVDVSAGFTSLGAISHSDLVPEPEDTGYDCYGYMPEVRRSVFIGDRVYSISDVGVKANAVGEGLTELNAVAFPANESYGRSYGWYDCYWPEPMPDDPEPTDPEEPPAM